MNFRMDFSFSAKKNNWDFDMVCIKSVDCFVWHWHLNSMKLDFLSEVPRRKLQSSRAGVGVCAAPESEGYPGLSGQVLTDPWFLHLTCYCLRCPVCGILRFPGLLDMTGLDSFWIFIFFWPTELATPCPCDLHPPKC